MWGLQLIDNQHKLWHQINMDPIGMDEHTKYVEDMSLGHYDTGLQVRYSLEKYKPWITTMKFDGFMLSKIET